MHIVDMPQEELNRCNFQHTTQPDFDSFWENCLYESKQQPLLPKVNPVEYTVPGVVVSEVSYEAFDGGRIAGWFIAPRDPGPKPTLIFYHSYGGTKGKVSDYLKWALQGFTCLAFDVRGQGGDSSDLAEYPPTSMMGWLTRGLMDPRRYYLVRCYVDAIRAIDLAETLDGVNSECIGLSGASQGGALALAACSMDRRPRLCMAELPAFCHFGRTFELSREAPWTEYIEYFQRYPERIEEAMRTLSYVELNNLTEHVFCPTLMNVCLQDTVTIPSTIYSAYNHLRTAEKSIEVFPYNEHEYGLMNETMIRWARAYLMDED